jgi:predicted membrane protein
MTLEQITILILCFVTFAVQYVVKKLARIKLHPLSLILFWPIIIAVINGYSLITKMVGVVLALVGIYLLTRSARKAGDTS